MKLQHDVNLVCTSSDGTVVEYVLDQVPTFDLAFQALSDPTRRAMAAGPSLGLASVSAPARPLPKSPGSASALTDAGGERAARSEKKGRERTCGSRQERPRRRKACIAEQRALWESGLERLAAYVEEMKAEEKKNGRA